MLGIIKFFLIILSPIFAIILILFLCVFFHYYHLRVFCKINPIPSDRSPNDFFYKPDKGFLKRVFWSFPKRFAVDKIERDPNEFQPHSLHLFVGKQGSGKTTAMCHMMLTLMSKYPKCKVFTNMNFEYQDGEINHWHDIVEHDNGHYGCIEVLDEIHTWFSSNESKNFPPSMLSTISQQRKSRKMILGSAQVFSRVAKPIREQTYRVYCPKTYFGCVTRVRITSPEHWSDEKQKFKEFTGSYWFVHDDILRNSFDTFAKIQKYKEIGFKEEVPVQ